MTLVSFALVVFSIVVFGVAVVLLRPPPAAFAIPALAILVLVVVAVAVGARDVADDLAFLSFALLVAAVATAMIRIGSHPAPPSVAAREDRPPHSGRPEEDG